MEIGIPSVCLTLNQTLVITAEKNGGCKSGDVGFLTIYNSNGLDGGNIVGRVEWL